MSAGGSNRRRKARYRKGFDDAIHQAASIVLEAMDRRAEAEDRTGMEAMAMLVLRINQLQPTEDR
ncbi:hypothetical protein [Rhizobium sp. S96]|uniref:hypothetical protein n=1 Tax=Rhizobium sp. S96 TaxID=3055140 RepID=UPI0025AA3A58|nr:hypothetical protein [Rhizobium sp. S96]MDM9619114.1 hypothetical protein [Rhizobium sp. S96]